ncbi:hypothetical protein GCM10010306_034930 [Streptomyces umbrinus]|nr:hypothetical protein GCM10010306_034930 [Streptomyces umbrinus]
MSYVTETERHDLDPKDARYKWRPLSRTLEAKLSSTRCSWQSARPGITFSRPLRLSAPEVAPAGSVGPRGAPIWGTCD